jgi:hypothetical protein
MIAESHVCYSVYHPVGEEFCRAAGTPNDTPKKEASLSLSAKQRAFRAAFGRCGVVKAAAKTAKIAHKSHHRWLPDPE